VAHCVSKELRNPKEITMSDEHSSLMSRIEVKKRELEQQLERARGDHSGVLTRDAQLIQNNLNELKELLRTGLEDLTEETIGRLEEWLPER
jgi:hypothetical protein